MKITSITIYKDGGSKFILLSNGKNYFIDNRLGSPNKGTIYLYNDQNDKKAPLKNQEKAKEIFDKLISQYYEDRKNVNFNYNKL